MSRLGRLAGEYLQLRRSLGHKLDEAGRLLPGFVAYLDASGIATVTVEAALAWACLPDVGPGSTVPARRMTAARGFAGYLAGVDPATEVPPAGLVSYPRRQRRLPYIYRPDEIDRLMVHARRQVRSPLRQATLATLIGLLAATGMRIGEAIRLDRADIDRTGGVLTIRATKFNKSRQLPVDVSTMHALDAYSDRRDELRPRLDTSALLVSTVGTRLYYTHVQTAFRTIVDAARIGAEGPVTPRIHDLRHTFAVATLLDWYRDGEDVAARLPALATYLGHHDPRSTYWYLTAVPELLALAAMRLDLSRVRP